MSYCKFPLKAAAAFNLLDQKGDVTLASNRGLQLDESDVSGVFFSPRNHDFIVSSFFSAKVHLLFSLITNSRLLWEGYLSHLS